MSTTAADPTLVRSSLEKAEALVDHLEALKTAERYGEAGEALGDGWRLFGLDPRALHQEDPRQVHRRLQHPELLPGFAKLLASAADLLFREGDPDSAASMARWTLSALLHGHASGDYSVMTGRLLALAGARSE